MTALQSNSAPKNSPPNRHPAQTRPPQPEPETHEHQFKDKDDECEKQGYPYGREGDDVFEAPEELRYVGVGAVWM